MPLLKAVVIAKLAAIPTSYPISFAFLFSSSFSG
jgi:hypothetical protein